MQHVAHASRLLQQLQQLHMSSQCIQGHELQVWQASHYRPWLSHGSCCQAEQHGTCACAGHRSLAASGAVQAHQLSGQSLQRLIGCLRSRKTVMLSPSCRCC